MRSFVIVIVKGLILALDGPKKGVLIVFEGRRIHFSEKYWRPKFGAKKKPAAGEKFHEFPSHFQIFDLENEYHIFLLKIAEIMARGKVFLGLRAG